MSWLGAMRAENCTHMEPMFVCSTRPATYTYWRGRGGVDVEGCWCGFVLVCEWYSIYIHMCVYIHPPISPSAFLRQEKRFPPSRLTPKLAATDSGRVKVA